MEGIAKADVVLYNGHSRGGGGPDFAPGKRLVNGHIDYEYYRSKKPGLSELLEILNKRKDGGPALLGFFSCNSYQHFSKSIQKASPKTSFVGTSTDPSWGDAHRGVLATLNTLLGKTCKAGFETALNTDLQKPNAYKVRNFP